MTDATAVDLPKLRAWIGRTQELEDRIDPWVVAGMHATLDLDGPAPETGAPLPEGWHWAFFREVAPARELGPDGHPVRGGFLPPVALERRMWAGGRLRFQAPLPVGATVRRHSTIQDVTLKESAGGPMVFVTVTHTIIVAGETVIQEAHDIVYLGSDRASAPARDAVRSSEPWRRTKTLDSTLLFRYSALTFNGHRIHYDADYCRDVEGYPGLVVHGPLTATLLLDLARRNAGGRRIAAFAFRARAPLFCGEPLELVGGPASGDPGPRAADEFTMSAVGPGGRLIMTASGRFTDRSFG